MEKFSRGGKTLLDSKPLLSLLLVLGNLEDSALIYCIVVPLAVNYTTLVNHYEENTCYTIEN